MKGKIVVFVFFTALIVSSQKREGTIYFKDGTKKVGYIRNRSDIITSKDRLEFRISKKSKEISEFKYTDISKIDFNNATSENIFAIFYYKTLMENSENMLEVSLIYKGYVSLYRHIGYFENSQGGGGSITEYYVQKGEENIVKIFPGKVLGKSSETLMKSFFEDCPKLVELIDRKAFKMFVANSPSLAKKRHTNRIIEIVKYYNSKCSGSN
ncbi:MAG: hypothetical protein V3U92_07445 [Cellulophaga sp.]